MSVKNNFSSKLFSKRSFSNQRQFSFIILYRQKGGASKWQFRLADREKSRSDPYQANIVAFSKAIVKIFNKTLEHKADFVRCCVDHIRGLALFIYRPSICYGFRVQENHHSQRKQSTLLRLLIFLTLPSRSLFVGLHSKHVNSDMAPGDF